MEFLQFHRDFVAAFHSWYDTQPFADQAAVAPWHAVPAELKVSAAGWTQGWANAEIRLQTNNPLFNNADEVGTFIELGIHNQFLHGAAAIVYNEPVVGTFHSPLSTYFYQVHGLVDWWRQHWEAHHLPNLLGQETLRALAVRLLGGVMVDGGGIAVGQGGPRPVDPRGPMLTGLTHDRVGVIVKDIQRLKGR